jgi:hypothetical protein
LRWGRHVRHFGLGKLGRRWLYKAAALAALALKIGGFDLNIDPVLRTSLRRLHLFEGEFSKLRWLISQHRERTYKCDKTHYI